MKNILLSFDCFHDKLVGKLDVHTICIYERMIQNMEKSKEYKLDLIGLAGKIPGGLLLVPMAIAALLNTFYPALVQIGNPTTAIFSSQGIMPITGIMLLFVGIQLDGKTLLAAMKRGGVLAISKLLINIAVSLLILKVFNLKGFLGLSALALVCCITSINPGIYVALMNQFGDKLDVAMFALLNLLGQPMVPICLLLFSSGQGLDIATIIATLIPFCAGLLLGTLDPRLKNACKNGITIMTPFLGFCLGNNINLMDAFSEAPTGILLYLIYMAVNLLPLLAIDRGILKQKGHASSAICCVAGLAIGIPAMVAAISPAFQPFADKATAQLVMAVILSTISCPILVKKLAGKKI